MQQADYNFFCKLPNKQAALVYLAKFLESMGNKILHHIQIWWMNMLALIVQSNEEILANNGEDV